MKTIRFNRADCPAWIIREIYAGREVYNAPRPIQGRVPGTEDGGLIYAGVMGALSSPLGYRLLLGHGMLFASLDPTMPEADRARKFNEDMDARLVELTDDDKRRQHDED